MLDSYWDLRGSVEIVKLSSCSLALTRAIGSFQCLKMCRSLWNAFCAGSLNCWLLPWCTPKRCCWVQVKVEPSEPVICLLNRKSPSTSTTLTMGSSSISPICTQAGNAFVLPSGKPLRWLNQGINPFSVPRKSKEWIKAVIQAAIAEAWCT